MYFLGAILFPGRANQQLLVKFPSLHDTLVVSHGWPGPIFRVPQQTYLSLSTTGYTSITARQLSSGNVMFSVVSVHHSVHEGRRSMWPLPMMHLISLYRAPQLWPHPSHLEMRHGTPQHIRAETPLAPAPALPTALLVTSGGDHWRPVQTRSFGILPLGMTSGGVHWNWNMWFPSRRYASYWNAFLFEHDFNITFTVSHNRKTVWNFSSEGENKLWNLKNNLCVQKIQIPLKKRYLRLMIRIFISKWIVCKYASFP